MVETVVITGANRGLGLALCHCYGQQGKRVYGLCRSASPALLGLGVKVIEGIDITDPKALDRLLAFLKGIPINLLINNAGLLKNDCFGTLKKASLLAQVETNTVGPLLLTEKLSGQLVAGARVVFIGSVKGSITENSTSGRYGYRISKAALNMAAVCLAVDLKPQGVSVAVIHPGSVSTEMSQGQGSLSAQQAAKNIAALTENLSLDKTGCFWGADGKLLNW